MSCGCNNTLPIVGGKRRRQIGKRNRTRRLRGGVGFFDSLFTKKPSLSPFNGSVQQSDNFHGQNSSWLRKGYNYLKGFTGKDTTQSSQSFGTSPPPLPSQGPSPPLFVAPPLPPTPSLGDHPSPLPPTPSLGDHPSPLPPTPSLGDHPSGGSQKYSTFGGGSRRRRKKSYKGKKLRCVYGNTNNKYKRHSRRKNRSNSSSRTRK